MFFFFFSVVGDGLIQEKELQHVMRACMDENGMKFDEGEVDELTRALFHDAVQLSLTPKASPLLQRSPRGRDPVAGGVAAAVGPAVRKISAAALGKLYRNRRGSLAKLFF